MSLFSGCEFVRRITNGLLKGGEASGKLAEEIGTGRIAEGRGLEIISCKANRLMSAVTTDKSG